VVIIVLDSAEVIPFTENMHHLGTNGFFSGNEEVGMAEEDFDKGGGVIEAVVQQNQIALFDTLDELVNEFVFRSAYLAVDEAQRSTGDEVKEAAKLDGNRPQSLLTLVGTETFPKGLRFGQGDSGLVSGNGAQSMPTAKVVFAGGLQP
jgi:hypothetical protein